MTRRQRLAARLLTSGLVLAGACLVLANVDSLIGDGTGARSVRLVAALVLLAEGLVLTLDGSRPWAPPGRRLVKAHLLERLYGIDGTAKAASISGRLLTGTIRIVLGQVLFVLGLVMVGFGALELTRVP